MIKVLYDSQIFNLQKYGGISRYFAELITGINNSKIIASVPEKYFSDNKYLRHAHLTHLDGFIDGFSFRGKKRIENYIKKLHVRSVIRELKHGNFDVFHPTYYNPYFLHYLPPRKPFVLTVHDMIHEAYADPLFENLSEETRHKRILIPKADHIVAVSQKTKEDILTFFPSIEKSKISVIYHGSSLSPAPAISNMPLPANYILYIGNRRLYKNFLWLVRSISDFLKEHSLTLLCVGGGDFSDYEMDYLRDIDIIELVTYAGIVDDNNLKVIYNKAKSMVFPSWYEGFGIPILEAFSCECPVILNDASCFREVAGDAALYFEKDNPESLIRQLTAVMVDPVLAKHLTGLGLQRLELYSWENTVRQHIEMYELLLSSQSN